MIVELFRANCKLCDQMEKLLRNLLPADANLWIHRAEECVDGSCCILAEKYGIRAVPSVVVNGKVIQTGLPAEGQLDEFKAVLT